MLSYTQLEQDRKLDPEWEQCYQNQGTASLLPEGGGVRKGHDAWLCVGTLVYWEYFCTGNTFVLGILCTGNTC